MVRAQIMRVKRGCAIIYFWSMYILKFDTICADHADQGPKMFLAYYLILSLRETIKKGINAIG